jgi:hypothetical protein
MTPLRQIIREEAIKGLVTGICIGVALTLAVGLTAVILGQLCILPLAPWCFR